MSGLLNRDLGRTDTIVAPATPPGRGAIAVVRLSGPDAFEAARRVLRGLPGAIRSRRALLVRVVDRSEREIDDAIAIFYRRPRSYTGEDMVEISCHGSPAVIRALMEACVAAGARPAEPGEFTFRALRAGKLDLAQAEAVADLVAAATVEQAHLAARQLGGEVGRELSPLAEEALELLAETEAGLDFAEEERGLGRAAEELALRCGDLRSRIGDLLRRSELAHRVREGAVVVLSGPPNSGKSSLFNNLVGSQRAIVTDEPGTTRDPVEETLVIDGLPIRLVDAAGIGAPASKADAAGQTRAREARAAADLVLEVYSLSGPHRPAPATSPAVLQVATHADLPALLPPVPGSLLVSNVTGEGLEPLRRAIGKALSAPGTAPVESVALASERHRAEARRAEEALARAERVLEEHSAPELAAVDLREAVSALRSILGQVGPEEILGRIFARFCIGK